MNTKPMKRSMKKFVAIVASMVMMLGLTACGDSSDSTNEESTYGQVSALSDTSITISVGTMGDKTVSGGAMGTRPDGVSGGAINGKGDGQAPPSGSGAPDGQEPPSGSAAPDGQAPSGSAAPDANGNRGGFGGFQATGESKTVTIDSDTQIYVQSVPSEETEGSISDISMGSLVAVVFAEDGTTATKITVTNMGGMKGNGNSNGKMNGGGTQGNGNRQNKSSNSTTV